MNLRNKTVCFVDNGLYVSFARRVAKEFGKAYYYAPWQAPAVRTNTLAVGRGYTEMEKLRFLFDKIDEVDLWVFLDVYFGDLQTHLVETGHRVWGARHGEELELNRWDFKKHLKKLGLPVQQCDLVVGMDELRSFLKDAKECFIKTDLRGDFETFRHQRLTLSEPWLVDLESRLGPEAANYEFVVEQPIADAVEIGFDGFTIDGQFPTRSVMAYEVKDCGMLGVGLTAEQLAKPVRQVNEALAPTFKSYGYKGFFSSEIRYTKDKKPYFIDPCCRLGTPSNELLQTMLGPWGQTLWDGADGVLTTPEAKAKFGCLLVLQSEWATEHWMAVDFNKEIEDSVMLRMSTLIGGKQYIVPQVVGIPDIGVVAGTGSTLVQAIADAKEKVKLVSGYQLVTNEESIEKGLDAIEEGKQSGIHFGL